MKKTEYFSIFLMAITVFSVVLSGCIFNKTENACIDTVKRNSLKNNVCTANYDPVCGCNGTTYSNSCEAEREGLTTYNLGICPQ